MRLGKGPTGTGAKRVGQAEGHLSHSVLMVNSTQPKITKCLWVPSTLVNDAANGMLMPEGTAMLG